MKVPVDLFLQAIEEKKVYFFSSNKINTDVPHFYVCIKRTPADILIMSCCTSQFDTVKNFIERRKLPYETLVYIKPDENNPFKKETFINCNEYKEFSVGEFKTMYESDAIENSGEISDVTYGQIIIGLHESPLIDEEIKELLPPKEDHV